MIPEIPPRKQPANCPQASAGTTPPPTAVVPVALDVPDNDSEPGPAPACCPCCRRPWFDRHHSGMLDMVLLAKDVLSDLQAALEEEVPR